MFGLGSRSFSPAVHGRPVGTPLKQCPRVFTANHHHGDSFGGQYRYEPYRNIPGNFFQLF
ncbi:MAG: hypothetical protein GWP07_03760 [Xanthomonadaceae bacterium]|nr:hypothetical protein [Xanthomonadaceae bacterium]